MSGRRSPSPSPLTHFSEISPFLEEDTEAQRNLHNSPNVPFYKFVLTGGPCAGKTTALARVSTFLRERGFEVATAPEAFTTLVNNGASLSYFGTEGMDAVIQNSVMSVQESLEDGLEHVLRARGLPAVLLCDRGLMDGAAYLSPERFGALMKLRGRSVTDLREGRYNAVFHMVTAADGAEEFYTLENNSVRSESIDQAILVDRNTQNAWVGHPHLFVVDNQSDFEGKLQRLVETVARLVGLPTNLSRTAVKFVLRNPPNLADFTVDYKVFEVEKVYLRKAEDDTDDKKYAFIRKRTTVIDGYEAGSVYGVTTVQQTETNNIDVKRIISRREYLSSFSQRDPNRHIIKQRRISFLYNLQSFNIHVSKRQNGLCSNVQVFSQLVCVALALVDLRRTRSCQGHVHSACAGRGCARRRARSGSPPFSESGTAFGRQRCRRPKVRSL